MYILQAGVRKERTARMEAKEVSTTWICCMRSEDIVHDPSV
jgi:hypothetical protein